MKTPITAVVIIPPESVWLPIQKIRQRNDRHFHRWMPHVTLLFPFVTPQEFPAAGEKIQAVCAGLASFPIQLANFHHFEESRTVWLDPEPSNAVFDLQAALHAAFPECDDASKFASGYVPHLSVGQGDGKVAEWLQAKWEPLEFECGEIAIIQRGDPPDDVFKIVRKFEFGQP